MSSHRRAVRPRYGRIAALATSVTVSVVAALAGLGVLTTSPVQAGPSAKPASYHQAKPLTPDGTTEQSSQESTQGSTQGSTQHNPPQTPAQHPTGTTRSQGAVGSPQGTATSAEAGIVTALPADSGHGRRIVFSQTRQRVWLVGDGDGSDDVERTYLVSGSVYHNLQPGTYAVYSKSRWAVGVDDSGVMQYFVRFTQGPTGAAIGFHSIPTRNGDPLQTRAQLGTAQSHGCIRQDLPDAIALWNFAPVDTKVVVVA